MMSLDAPAVATLMCDYCGAQVDRRELKQHQAFECEQSELRIMQCPKGCGQNIEARDMERHVLQECPLELVPCDFQLSGCPRRITRRAKREHNAENMEYHLGLINKGALERDERMAKLEKQLRARELELQGLYTALEKERAERKEMMTEFEERIFSLLETYEDRMKDNTENCRRALAGSKLTSNNVDGMRKTVDGLTYAMSNVQKEQQDILLRVRRAQAESVGHGAGSRSGTMGDAMGSAADNLALRPAEKLAQGHGSPAPPQRRGSQVLEKRQGSQIVDMTLDPDAMIGDPQGAPVEMLLKVHQQDGPYYKIADAVRAAKVGDKITVAPGRYVETIRINRPIEIIGQGHVSDVVIESSGKDTIVFDTDFGVVARVTIRQRGTGFWNCIDCVSGQLNLEGCDVSSQSLTCISIHKKETNPRIWRNRIHNCGGVGIYCYDSARASVEDNDIYDNGQSGIEISEAANPEIKFNRIRNNAQHGVLVHDNGKGDLTDNEIFKNNLAGIEIRESGNPRIIRNKIYQQESSGGIYIHHYGRALIEKNDIYHNSLSGVTVWKSGKPICKQNRISKNGEYGIHVRDGGWGTFEENDVRANGRGGLLVTLESSLKVVQERNLVD